MSKTAQTIKTLLMLAETAKVKGCCEAEPFLAREIVVDPRVRMKCRLNLCGQFGRNLMCPPNVWDLAETSSILARYTFSLLLQITREAAPNEYQTVFDREKNTMNAIVVSLEHAAFQSGFSLAVGLGCGHCQLCYECADEVCPSVCRRPAQARPSLEAVGIDVEKTCAAAGLPAGFSPGRVTLSGLLLLD